MNTTNTMSSSSSVPPGEHILTTSLGQYHIHPTKDGSMSLWSSAFGESCHSLDGASDETHYHYIEGTFLAQRAQDASMHVLEMGLGSGLGLAMTVECLSATPGPHIITTLELDGQLAAWVLARLGFDSSHKSAGTFRRGNVTINVLVGDARQTLSLFPEVFSTPVTTVFQDAFSPGRNPWPWTRQWFEQVRSVSAPDCILATYSASARARKAMALSGWQVFSLPGHGHKRACTRATLGPKAEALFSQAENITPKLLCSNTQALCDIELAQKVQAR